MKKYLHRANCDYEELKEIEASESLEINLDSYDIENDPDGILDIENMDDDTSFLCNSYDEYKKLMQLFDGR